MMRCSTLRLGMSMVLALLALGGAASREASAVTCDFGPSGTPIVVEQGGTEFGFDAVVTGATDLWVFTFWVQNPTDGPGTAKPHVSAITQGGWWDEEFEAHDHIDYWTVGGNPPEIETGTPKSGTGALAHITVNYAGIDPGSYPATYTLTFPDDYEKLSLVSYDLDPEKEPDNHEVTVTNLVIQVLASQAPTPNPMTWAAVPYAASTTSIEMTATEATDNVTPIDQIEYRVDADGPGGETVWQTSRDFAFDALGVNTPHTYAVQARDELDNQTAWSTPSVTVYTLANPPDSGTVGTVTSETIEVSWSANGNPAYTRYVVECYDEPTFTNPPVETSGEITATTYTFGQTVPLTDAADYYIRVKAINGETGQPGGDFDTDWHDFNNGDPIHTPAANPPSHDGDYRGSGPNWVIDLLEVMRMIVLYNGGEYHVDAAGLDGFNPGPGSHDPRPHDGDYRGTGPNWVIDLLEVMRAIQLYNGGEYHVDATQPDGFAPGPGSHEAQNDGGHELFANFVVEAPGKVAEAAPEPRNMPVRRRPVLLGNFITDAPGKVAEAAPQPLAPVSRAAASEAGDGDKVQPDGIQALLATVSVTRSHAPTYTPGQNFDVTINVTYDEPLDALAFIEYFPPGWQYVSVADPGQFAIVTDYADRLELMYWGDLGKPVPASPFSFTYTLSVPADQTGMVTFTGDWSFIQGIDNVEGVTPPTTADGPQPPVIAQIDPDSGPPFTQGILTGSHFGAAEGRVVFLGGGEIDWTVLSWSDTQIDFRVAVGTSVGAGQVKVIDAVGTESATVPFTVTNPDDLYVDDDNATGIENGTAASPFSTIGEGMVAATAGDTVHVADGTYNAAGEAVAGDQNRDMDFGGKGIVVQGNPGNPAACIIDCGGSAADPHRAFLFENDETSASVVDGFTIQGGYNVGDGGGAIVIDYFTPSADGPTISNNRFTDNTAASSVAEPFADGGAIRILNASPTISGNEFNDNLATSAVGDAYGGAIHCADSAAQITGNTFGNCTADSTGGTGWGGAIYALGSDLSITGNIFDGNQADGLAVSVGGAVALGTGSNGVVRGNDFTSNRALAPQGSGGAVYCAAGVSPEVDDNDFEGNFAGRMGGAVTIMDGSTANIHDNLFSGNAAGNGSGDDAYGGGIYLQGVTGATLRNNVFQGNVAVSNGTTGSYGGAVKCSNARPTLVNNTFGHNAAVVTTGTNSYGGAMEYAAAGSAGATGKNSIFWGNVADNGPQIALRTGATLNLSYCCIEGGVPTGVTDGGNNTDQDPLFADPGTWDDGGTPGDYSDDSWEGGDYHVKSIGGRFDETLADGGPMNPLTWVYDTVTSPCVDTGDPGDPVGDELEPNGDRINMGAYGGIDDASKSELTLTVAVEASGGATPDLEVLIDGVPYTAPKTIVTHEGTVHSVSVTSPQPPAATGTRYLYQSWSDSGAQTHDVTMGLVSQTVTANFQTEHETTIATVPSGLEVLVGTEQHTAEPYSFWAEEGATVIVEAISPQVPEAGTEYQYDQWLDDPGASRQRTIPVDGPATYTANYTTWYQLTTVVPTGGGQIARDPNLPGGLYPATSQVTLDAVPEIGWRFDHWAVDLTGSTDPETLTMDGAKTVEAHFVEEVTITIATNPAGLMVRVDGVEHDSGTSGYAFITDRNATHTISVDSPQPSGVTGTKYVYASWSDGDAQSHEITANATKTITATFDTWHQLTIVEDPDEGGDVLLSDPGEGDPWYKEGTPVTLTADANEPDWEFSHWDNDTDDTATDKQITMNAPQTHTAHFISVFQITIRTDPAGLKIRVDGAEHDDGYSFTAHENDTFTIGVDSPQPPAATGTKYKYLSWDDGGAQSHEITVTETKTITATLEAWYQLTVGVTPPLSGEVILDPEGEGDPWYKAGTSVSLMADPATGWEFDNWDGDAGDTTNPKQVDMDQVRSHTAHFAVQQFTLAVNSTPIQGIDISGTHGDATNYTRTLDYGDPVTLEAPDVWPAANPQWDFVRWDRAGGTPPAPGVRTINVTMNQEETVTAVYQEKAPPELFVNIGDVTQVEGDAGTTTFDFAVTLSSPATETVTVQYSTANGSATVADGDYDAVVGGIVTFNVGDQAKPAAVEVNGDTKVEPDETFTVTLINATGATIVDGEGLGTIVNDDGTTISIDDVTLAEGDAGPTAFEFTVSLGNESAQTVTVDYATADGTAAAAEDYTAVPTTELEFAPGETSKKVTVQVNGDVEVEADETFFVNLSNATGATIADSQGQGTITNDDTATLTLAGVTASQPEGTGGTTTAFEFSVTLDNPVQGGLDVAYTTSDDTATVGDADYADNDASLHFAGTASEVQTITVQVNHDAKVEADELFDVALGAVSGLGTGIDAGDISTAGTPATGTVVNDDTATLTLAGVAASQNEGTGGTTTDFTFSVTLDAPVQGGLDVAYTTNDDTATVGDGDYADNDASLHFAGTASEVQTITVQVNHDATVEADELFDVVLGAISGLGAGLDANDISIAGTPATGTVLNDDTATLTLAGVAASQNEGTGGTTTDFTFSVTLDNPVQGGLDVAYTTDDDTATVADGDYVDNDGSLTFAGTAAESQTITVQVSHDAKVEADELFTVALGAVSGLGTGVDAGDISTAGTPATGTVLNDDAATVTLAGVAASQNEGTGGTTTDFTFSVTLDNPVQGGFDVAYTTNDDTATVADGDYVDNDGSLTFAGTAAESQTITVQVSHDAKVETDELFEVALGAISGLGAGVDAADITTAGTPATGTILNDDGTLMSIDNVTQVETDAGPTTFEFTVSLTQPSPVTVTVEWATGDGTAEDGDGDYTAASGQVSFPPGSQSQPVEVQVTGDAKVEADETFMVNLSSPVGATLADAQGVGTVLNDDAATLTLAGVAATQDEGTGGTTTDFTFSVTLDSPVQGGLDVAYTTNDGTATVADGDYVDNDGSLSFAGTAGESKTITVQVNHDATVESDELFSVALGAISGLGAGIDAGDISTSGTPASGTVLNDDMATLTLAGVAASQNEGTGGTTTDFTFSVTLDSPVQGGLDVAYTTNDGTATVADGDYVDNDGSLSFAGTGGESKTITVQVSHDATVESDELFSVALGAISGLGAGIEASDISPSGTPASGTVLNDDTATLTLAGVAATQNEGTGGTTTDFTFSVTLDNPVQGGFDVAYTTNDGTATVGDGDYVDNDGSLTFAGAAAESQTITVQVNHDAKVEADELFSVALGALSSLGAGIDTNDITKAGTPATGTVVNDDTATLTLAGVAASQNEGTGGTTTDFTFSVTLDNPVQGGFDVAYTTDDDTATVADGDYVDNDGSLTFAGAAAESQTITVQVNHDATVEADELLDVVLGAISGLGAGLDANDISIAGTPATGTVLNDDTATLTLAGVAASQNEGTGGTTTDFTFSVTLDNPVQGGFDVAYTTDDDTATVADGDYVDNDGSLTFAGTAAESKTITVQVNHDAKAEADELFTVALGALSNLGAGVDANDIAKAGTPTTGTILNDDVPERPSGFTHIAKTANSITWSWTDNSDFEDGFRIDPPGHTVAAGVTAWDETVLTPNTQYQRHVVAYNAVGDSAASNDDTVYTLANIPINAGFGTRTATSVEVEWQENSNPLGTEYQVECWEDAVDTGTKVGDSGWIEDDTPGDTMTFDFTGLTPNTPYCFRVRARNHDDELTDWVVFGSGSLHTLAAVPGQFDIQTTSMTPPPNSTLDLNAPGCRHLGVLGIALNGNPDDTLIAIQVSWTEGAVQKTGWLRLVNNGGRIDIYPDGAQAEWRTAAEWGGKRLRKLQPDTVYQFEAKSKNAMDEETALVDVDGPNGYKTNKDGDVDNTGLVTITDYVYVRSAILKAGVIGEDFSWATDVTGDGLTNVFDLSWTRWKAVNP